MPGVSEAFGGDFVADGANGVTRRFDDGSQALRALPLEAEPDGGGVAPTVPEGGDHLPVGAPHSGGHLVGDHHRHVAAGCHSDQLLGEAAEQASPQGELVEERPKGRRHTVDDQEADPGVGRQEAGHQAKLCQELHVVMTTHLARRQR